MAPSGRGTSKNKGGKKGKADTDTAVETTTNTNADDNMEIEIDEKAFNAVCEEDDAKEEEQKKLGEFLDEQGKNDKSPARNQSSNSNETILSPPKLPTEQKNYNADGNAAAPAVTPAGEKKKKGTSGADMDSEGTKDNEETNGQAAKVAKNDDGEKTVTKIALKPKFRLNDKKKKAEKGEKIWSNETHLFGAMSKTGCSVVTGLQQNGPFFFNPIREDLEGTKEDRNAPRTLDGHGALLLGILRKPGTNIDDDVEWLSKPSRQNGRRWPNKSLVIFVPEEQLFGTTEYTKESMTPFVRKCLEKVKQV